MKKTSIVLLFAGLLISYAYLVSCNKNKTNKPVYLTDCGDSLVGSYVGADYCSSSGNSTYPCSITASTPTNIIFSYMGGAPNVTATVDCNNNTIAIPTQNFVGNYSISGTGTFTTNRIIINWNGLSLGQPISCSTTFTR